MNSLTKFAVLAAVVGWALIAAPAARAQNIWQNPSGGNWHDDANWTDFPGTSDIAEFRDTVPVSGEVYLTDDVVVEAIGDAVGIALNLRGFDLATSLPNETHGTVIYNTATTRSSLQTVDEVGPDLTIGRGVDALIPGTLTMRSSDSLTVTDGGTVEVTQDLAWGGEEIPTAVRISGLGSSLTVQGNLNTATEALLEFPFYRIFVEDQGLLDVRGSLSAQDQLDSIDVRNGIVRANSDFGDRQARGYGVIITPSGADLSALEITNPLDSVDLESDLEIDSQTATIFSIGTASLGKSTRVISPTGVPAGVLKAVDGYDATLGGWQYTALRVDAGETLFSDGTSEIHADIELAGGVLDVAGSLTDTATGFDGQVSGYGVVLRAPSGSLLPIATAPTGTVVLEDVLDVPPLADATIFTDGPAQLGPNTTLSGATLKARGDQDEVTTLLLGDGDTLSGSGNVDAQFIGSAASHIEVTGARLNIGSTDVSNGFQTEGRITLNGDQLVLRDVGVAQLGSLTELNGNELDVGAIGPGAIGLGQGDRLNGPGLVTASVIAAAGSSIHAVGGDLTLGNFFSSTGFVSDGELVVGSGGNAILHDANQAVLGSLTTLVGSGSSTGTLTADNGILVEFGRNLTGFGTVDTPNDPLRPTIINGDAAGNSASEPLTLNGYVKGVGTFADVVFNGTFAPGLSPAAVETGNLAFGSESVLEIELGGRAPGSQHDQLVVDGAAQLDGTLTVSLLNGFQPQVGDEFEILKYSSLSGAFDEVVFAGPLAGALNYGAGSLVLTVVAVPEPSTVALIAVAVLVIMPPIANTRCMPTRR